jgi:acyl homoserine lactone synthase
MRTHIITPKNRKAYSSILSDMFVQRKQLFVDRLGWDNMVVVDGQEHDDADSDPDVEYIVTIDKSGSLLGSSRLTPSLGKCLLRGPLAYYCETPVIPSPITWELTRLAPSTDPDDPINGRSFAFLAAGILEWAVDRGITRVLGIAEPPLIGIAGGLGVKLSIDGPPIEYEPGKVAFAFSFGVDQEALETARKALQFSGRVTIERGLADEVAA